MKNKIFILFCLWVSAPAFSQELELSPLMQVMSQVKSQTFTYRGHSLLFGFNSLHSCLYTSKNLAVVKHYCYPKKDYPAQGYKIISAQYGVIDFYQENLPSGAQKRDIFVSTFPEHLRSHLSFSLADSDFTKINGLIETLYQKNLPACWSTNFSMTTSLPEVHCRPTEIKNFSAWSTETQAYVATATAWQSLLKTLVLKTSPGRQHPSSR